MAFTWPLLLFALALVPLLAALYLWRIDAQDRSAAALGLRLTEGSGARRLGGRRHVPPALFLAAITVMLVALARPSIVLALPRLEGTVILAFDVSTSMSADDVEPTRMEAAKVAASAFAKRQPSTIKTGVVAFSDSALIVQQPTTTQSDVLSAIGRLQPQGGTSLSEAIFASLGAIAGRPIVVPPDATDEDLLALDIGYYGSAVIILLSDGEHLTRADPLTVAQMAGGAGVRVFTIGLGSAEGATLEVDGYHIATALNEELLAAIAKATDAEYFRAEDDAQLADVYDAIDLKLEVKGERTEVTALFAGGAMLLLLAGAALTLRWYGRAP